MSNEGEMFPQTRWSQLARLKAGDDTEKREVLGTLYQLYRKPVLAYLARRGFGHEKAEDLVQDFFCTPCSISCLKKQTRNAAAFAV
jgi:hypothetical protein|uniref:hypothetical protein n=1 Tax=Prosthecobacter sp. TaxID=1965333 RepID=UPI00378485E7